MVLMLEERGCTTATLMKTTSFYPLNTMIWKVPGLLFQAMVKYLLSMIMTLFAIMAIQFVVEGVCEFNATNNDPIDIVNDQIGGDILGSDVYDDYCGSSLDLSNDGKVVVIAKLNSIWNKISLMVI